MTDSGAATQLRVELARGGFRLALDAAFDERVAVIFGASGAGKSTLLEWVLGLRPEARGRLRLAGEWLEDAERGLRVAAHRRGLGWVPQEGALFPHLRVAENLRFGRARAGEDAGRRLDRAVEVLEIGALLPRRVDELSGGERQRVALARALASGPRALLLDEPLASLDLPLRARVLPYLLRVRNELGLPMLVVTHDPDEAQLLGERALVLDGGRLVAEGRPRDVLWSRAVLPLAIALGLENVFEGAAEVGPEQCAVRTRGGLHVAVSGRLAPGERVRLGLRAEDVLLAAGEPGVLSARNVWPARVVACEAQEDGVLVHLDAGEPLVAKLTPAAVRALGLGPGVRVHAVVKAQALRRIG